MKSAISEIIFSILMEYVLTPLLVVSPIFVFMTLNLWQVWLIAIWARVGLELFVRVIASAWYGEKYSRQK